MHKNRIETIAKGMFVDDNILHQGTFEEHANDRAGHRMRMDGLYAALCSYAPAEMAEAFNRSAKPIDRVKCRLRLTERNSLRLCLGYPDEDAYSDHPAGGLVHGVRFVSMYAMAAADAIAELSGYPEYDGILAERRWLALHDPECGDGGDDEIGLAVLDELERRAVEGGILVPEKEVEIMIGRRKRPDKSWSIDFGRINGLVG